MSEKQTPKPSIGDIIGGAAASETAAANQLPDLQALADRVELLTADFGRWDSYKSASAEYVTEFKDELKSHRKIRFWVSVSCVFLVAFFIGVLIVALCNAKTLFSDNQQHALTALIVATVTGSVIVTIALTKGAFQTLADRNAGLPMPDHMKEIVEAGKSIIGAGKV